MFNYRKSIVEQTPSLWPWATLPTFTSRISAIYQNFLGAQYSDDFNRMVLVEKNYIFLPFLNTGLFISGLIYLLVTILRKREKWLSGLLIFVLFVLIQITMGFYLAFNLDRYFIQLVLFFSLFQAAGLVYLVNLIKMSFHLLFDSVLIPKVRNIT